MTHRLGFCWICLFGSVVYDMMLDWWACDSCGVVALRVEDLARQ